MVGGDATLINGTICTTMTSGVGIETMMSGVSAWKIVGGPVRDTSILDAVVVLHEVASVDLVDRTGLPVKSKNCY